MEVDPLPDIDSEDLDILPISEQEWKDLMEEFECPDIQIELIEPEGISKFFGNFDPENSDTEQILPSLNPDEGSTVTSKVSEKNSDTQDAEHTLLVDHTKNLTKRSRKKDRQLDHVKLEHKKLQNLAFEPIASSSASSKKSRGRPSTGIVNANQKACKKAREKRKLEAQTNDTKLEKLNKESIYLEKVCGKLEAKIARLEKIITELCK